MTYNAISTIECLVEARITTGLGLLIKRRRGLGIVLERGREGLGLNIRTRPQVLRAGSFPNNAETV